MSIPDYNGETFVAFADISGFKVLMKNKEDAIKALDQFYTAGYSVLQETQQVHGLFVSDCAVLFVNAPNSSLQEKLAYLLGVIETLNREMLRHDVMLKTSIAYGQFSYHQRLEFPGIEKNPIYGNAYVAAFIDNESERPPLEPGKCRLVAKGLENLKLQVPRLKREREHYYFYWMAQDDGAIPAFSEKYASVYQQKYRGMLEALKDAVQNGERGHP